MRMKYQKRFSLDDYILLIGSVLLVTTFTLVCVGFEDIYWMTSLQYGPPQLQLEPFSVPDGATRVTRIQQIAFAIDVITWATIFAIKFSYLVFFRQMIDRLKLLIIAWKAITGIVILSGVYCIASKFFACSGHFGLDVGKYFQMISIQ